MPSAPSLLRPPRPRHVPAGRPLLTSEQFLAWLQPGVQEYWILDPRTLEHHFYRRTGDMLSEFAGDAERIESPALPGFWIKRAWLDPDRRPAVRACLAEIAGGRRRRA